MKSAAESKLFSTNKTLNLRGRLIDLGVPRIMGILNITPDSFYEGSRFTTETAILKNTEKMLLDGATFIDVGGYSTRPGAADISVEEETNRVVRAIRTILGSFPEALISIDTFRSEVASAAVLEGAALINDVSGGSLDPAMFETVARLKVPYILMHMRGTPQTMTQHSQYENLVKEITDYFHQKIFQLHQLEVRDIIVDPGFGFAKTPTQNFELLHHLDHFRILGKPILAGLSRKSMIWRTLSLNPEEALNGTTALNTVALLKGAGILRVHDVKEAQQVVQLLQNLPHAVLR
jgi:dihydropteroate synthase